MSFASSVADIVLEAPARNELIYRIARRIVSRHRGENDWRMWRNGEYRLLREVIPRCTTVFDVGANVGAWSAEAWRVNPSIELHCFEPAKASFEQLVKAVPDAHCNNAAVGSETGTLTLNIFGDASEINSFYRNPGHEMKRTEKVPVITLDDYASEIDFLKIDVEGHEKAVLEGARHLLSERRIKRIQFEYGHNYMESRTLLRDIFELLDGYSISKILPHRVEPVPYDRSLENFQLANYYAALSL